MRASGEPYPVAPSGEQIEIRSGDQRVVVVEVGGALRSYRAADGEILEGYAADEQCTGGRGQSLIPWPNRLAGGTYSFGGQQQQVALSEPTQGNAIHGLVRWANWTAIERAEEAVTMAYRLHPQPGWPVPLDLRISYSLADDGLTVRTTATNIGADPCPYGAGAHPYLTLGTETIDPLVVQAPGRVYMRTDAHQIPTESISVEGTPFDFLEPRALADTVLDTGYEDLRRDPDGRARVKLSSADGERRAALWMDEQYAFLMLFTGDTLSDPKRRRTGLGIEPMTCAPNALQTGDGLRTIAPGESFTSAWGIEPG